MKSTAIINLIFYWTARLYWLFLAFSIVYALSGVWRGALVLLGVAAVFYLGARVANQFSWRTRYCRRCKQEYEGRHPFCSSHCELAHKYMLCVACGQTFEDAEGSTGEIICSETCRINYLYYLHEETGSELNEIWQKQQARPSPKSDSAPPSDQTPQGNP